MSCKKQNIFELQIWLEGDDTLGIEDQFRTMYFDVSKITGWFIPDQMKDGEKAINLLFEGDIISIKQEEHIINYLTNNWIEIANRNLSEV
jgi:hypothetical protein